MAEEITDEYAAAHARNEERRQRFEAELRRYQAEADRHDQQPRPGVGLEKIGNMLSVDGSGGDGAGGSSGVGGTSTTFYAWSNGVIIAHEVEARNPRVVGSL